VGLSEVVARTYTAWDCGMVWALKDKIWEGLPSPRNNRFPS